MAVAVEELAVLTPTDDDPDIFCQPMLAADASACEDTIDTKCTVQKGVIQQHEVVGIGAGSEGIGVLAVSPACTLALLLTRDIVVEITLQKQVRICKIGCCSASICRGGRVAAVHHPIVEIIQQEGQVLFDLVEGPRVRSFNDTVHVLGARETPPELSSFVSSFVDPSLNAAHSELLVHTMNAQSVLSHANFNVSADRFRLRRDIDPTVALFLDDVVDQPIMMGFAGAQHPSKRDQCIQAAKQAIVLQRGSDLSAIVLGVKIKHSLTTGDTRIYCGRNYISLRVETQALTLHSPWVDINVDRWMRTRLRRGDQIIESADNVLAVTQNANKQYFRLSATRNPSLNNHLPIPIMRLTKQRFTSISDGYDTACSTSKSSESI
ncbi:hypothetical protein AAVH_07440 [Aphelenchoides avenae]|nr:hypothetical protein AAVH_07440 [Aphelenchus avenae]